ncbi:MAG: ABC transporter permease [Actinomycetota bacterium]|mgnify:CR=1 FL=1
MTSTSTTADDTRNADPEPPTRKLARPRQSFVAAVPNWVYTLIVGVVVTLLTELAARNEVVSSLILPAPSAVIQALWGGITSGLYITHMWATLVPSVIGFVVSAVIAIALGGVLGSVQRLEKIFMPFVIAFQSTPKIAIAPLIVLWLGFGSVSKSTIVGVVAFFPILVNTIHGMRIHERERVELMRVMGASSTQLFRYMRLPNAVPYIFAGLHVGVIFSLIGAVVAEFVGTRAGLGYLMLQQKALFNVPGVFALLLMLMLIGVFLHLIMLYIERKVAFWAQDSSLVSV